MNSLNVFVFFFKLYSEQCKKKHKFIAASGQDLFFKKKKKFKTFNLEISKSINDYDIFQWIDWYFVLFVWLSKCDLKNIIYDVRIKTWNQD